VAFACIFSLATPDIGARYLHVTSLSEYGTFLLSVFTTNSTIRIVFPNSIRDYFNRPIFGDYSINRVVLEYYLNNT
jgi:hypothetical protein